MSLRGSAQALLAHLTEQPWMDHPDTPRRRRRASVARMLGLTLSEAAASAARMAAMQARRGIKTIDTRTMPGTIGAEIVGAFVLLAMALLSLGCVSLRGEGAINVSYLVAGGAAHPGGKAPATGGVALMPTGRLLLASSVADPYVAFAPSIVAPTTLKSMGFLGAADGGLAWHPSTRGWSLGTGATIAPTYLRFCNAAWCLKEWVALYGGEAHFGTRVVKTEGEGGLTASLSARVLTGRPTAWFHPSLSPVDADVNHWIVSAGGVATWRF